MLGFYPLGGAPLADDGANAATPIAFAGTAVVTFGQSAAFTTVPQISATASIQFSQTGALTVAQQFAGTNGATFGQSATFTVPGAAPVAFSGSIAVAFGASGVISAPTVSGAIIVTPSPPAATLGAVSVSFGTIVPTSQPPAATFASASVPFGEIVVTSAPPLAVMA
jgi:hypothetical protein